MTRTRSLVVTAIVALLLSTGCRQAEPPKRYPITGQVLAINTDTPALTIRHEDIAGFMPGMTMTFPVADRAELAGRSVGELVSGTLEVASSQGRLRELVHLGTAPLAETPNQLAIATELLDIGAEVPDAAFVDQTDTRRSFAEWRGSVTVVTFIYASCPLPNFCPLMDQNFATLQDLLAEDAALRGQVKLVSISIDPARDTPAALAAHAKQRRSDPAVWTWLTGDLKTIDRFAGRFGVGIVRPTDATEINHNLRTAVIDRAGRLTKYYAGNNWTPGELVTELRSLAVAR